MKVAVFVLGILLCSAAIAAPTTWMKKENPETLHFYVSVDPNCPFSDPTLRELVNGVLIRTRLRPGDYSTSPEMFGFRVRIDCMKSGDDFFTYNIDTTFVRLVFGRTLTETSRQYGNIGRGGRDFILKSAQDSVEGLITDYLQANFDLTPD